MNIRSLMRIAGQDCTQAEALKAAAAAESYIFAYCGIRELPCALERIALSMAAALLRQPGAVSADESAGVKSVKVGDTQVEFGSAGEDAVMAVCRGYNEILNRYRRIRWS
ncbi:MAG: hypothetical protein IK118_05285 [Clostridia bacterium]|nr:hypothetical protein [Clostridia bacterium]